MISTANKVIFSGFIILCVLSISCKKEVPGRSPSVVTTLASQILYFTATSGGTVVDGGGIMVYRGICWDTISNPTVNKNKTSDGTGEGDFTSSMTGLKSGIKYHVRAYASNSVGIEYGNEITFTTHVTGIKFNPALIYGSLTDIEGKTYKTIPIGSQIWMAENLKTGKFNDGTSIPVVTSNADWTNLVTPARCGINNNDSINENIYGSYYNWFAVNTAKLCPTGWHIPTDSEWQTLTDFLGGDKVAGSKLKEAATNNWVLSNRDATNQSGFTGLPAGLRESTDGSFQGQGSFGGWWSATEVSAGPLGAALSHSIYGDTTVVARNQIFKKDGFTVRCLKN
jgi:uncharacterized protein (TIGR02145 family)